MTKASMSIAGRIYCCCSTNCTGTERDKGKSSQKGAHLHNMYAALATKNEWRYVIFGAGTRSPAKRWKQE
ncbi:MAG: hypothetical protein V4754_04555 [Pseudomonadota bacterium]